MQQAIGDLKKQIPRLGLQRGPLHPQEGPGVV